MAKKSQQILRYIIILFVVIVVAAIGYRTYQIQQEKRDFAKAEQSIDSLAQQIEQTIGKPDETKKEKSCDRANLKSEQGPLGCVVAINLYYKNRGSQGANELLKKLSTYFSGNIRIGSGAASGSLFVNKELQRGTQIFYQDLPSVARLSCGLDYRYPSGVAETIAENNEDGFAVGVSCGGPSFSEYYPVK